MTFGLLLCDHVDESLRYIAGDYDDMFRTWLPGDWRVFDLTAGQQPSPADCDAWVGTGSRYSVYDDIPWIHNFAAFLRTLHRRQRPFLGVCFGHQMMGYALGGRVERTVRGWGVGVHQFDIIRSEPWMQPPLEHVSALMSCRDQVEALPPDAVTLAYSKHCPVAMFRTGTCLGVQGHPEWELAYAEALLTRRAELLGPELTASARGTLTHRRNSAELAAWARNWLTQAHPAPETESPAPATTADPNAA